MATILPRSFERFGERRVGAHKYNANGTMVDGIRFSSKHEAEVYCELLLRQKAGEIKLILRQVPFELSPADGERRAVKYVADFVVHYADGRLGVLDAKGVATAAYKAKKRWVEQRYGVKIEEV